MIKVRFAIFVEKQLSCDYSVIYMYSVIYICIISWYTANFAIFFGKFSRGLNDLQIDTMITEWDFGKFVRTHHPHLTECYVLSGILYDNVYYMS